MLVLQHRAATWVVLPVLFSSCAFRPLAFQVVPGASSYLLRSPDRQETPFSNILRDYNGFEPGKAWVDLRPLMEIRVENAYYQPGSSRRGLDGYLGTEVARYSVNADGLRLLATQPMQGRPAGEVPVQGLLSSTVANARWYRLYFEIVFNRSTNSHGSVLLAADSAEQLEGLSDQLSDPEKLCGRGSAHCTAFPEACTVSIEVRIVVNGKDGTRDWGSLLQSVVGDRPNHLQLRRLYAGRLTPVKVDGTDQAALRLPLLPGDHITWD